MQTTNQPYKILFVLNSFGTGGSEKIVLDLSCLLNKELFECYVVALYDGDLQQCLCDSNTWCKCLCKKDGLDFPLMREIAKLIKEEKIDLINAHHFSPFIHSIYGALSNKIPIVYTEHTIEEIKHIPKYWKKIACLLLKKSNCFALGISPDISSELNSQLGILQSKTSTILNAIDISHFYRKKPNTSLLNKVKDNSENIIIGVVGNLRCQKNHKCLLYAFQLLEAEIPQVRLLIVGAGPEEESLKQLSRDLGIHTKVTFTGAKLSTWDIYPIFDIYCLPSHYEGLPLTILEAMAAEIPVVGTKVNGIRDIITNGKTGILVEPDNPAALAKGIKQLICNKEFCKCLSKEAFSYVQKKHNKTDWISAYEKHFVHYIEEYQD